MRNDRVATKRTSSCSSWRTPSTRSTTSSWTVIEAKLGSSWNSCRPVSFPLHRVFGEMLGRSRSKGILSRTKLDRQAFGTWNLLSRMIFADPVAFLRKILSEGIGSMSSHMSESIYSSTTKKNEIQPSAKDSVQSSSVEETLQRIMGQTNNDCRFRIFILTSSLRQQPSLVGR